jgi:hypothetical protein
MGLLLAMLACDGGDAAESGCDPADPCACEPAAVEVGGGEDAFVPVSDGAEAVMVHGPQGGWHVLASARFANTSETVTIHYTIEVPSLGAVVSDNVYKVYMLRDGECGGYYPAMYGYLNVTDLVSGDADTPPEILAGEELVLRLDVVDFDGREASDELRAVATPDPVDVD